MPPPSKDKALASLDKIEAGTKQAFTDAVASLFVVAGVLGLVALALTLMLPQVHLRKQDG